jgi:hypothetical protein
MERTPAIALRPARHPLSIDAIAVTEHETRAPTKKDPGIHHQYLPTQMRAAVDRLNPAKVLSPTENSAKHHRVKIDPIDIPP